MARSIQLVDHAKAKGTAANRSAIEVAGRVADDTGMGVAPLGRSRDAVQPAQGAGRIQLVHPAGAGAAVGSGPVEVARRVADYTCDGIRSLRRVGLEIVEHDFSRRLRLRCSNGG